MQKNKGGNIATTISDHLTQFLAVHSREISIPYNHNIMTSSFKVFDPTKFKNELTKTNWKNKLQLEKNNSQLSLRFFLKTIAELLNRQRTIKKVSEIRLQVCQIQLTKEKYIYISEHKTINNPINPILLYIRTHHS